jgi:hypothetical protein
MFLYPIHEKAIRHSPRIDRLLLLCAVQHSRVLLCYLRDLDGYVLDRRDQRRAIGIAEEKRSSIPAIRLCIALVSYELDAVVLERPGSLFLG